jgi:hypothetical protein
VLFLFVSGTSAPPPPRYAAPHAAHATDAGGTAPDAIFTPHWHIHPVTRAGLPTASA